MVTKHIDQSHGGTPQQYANDLVAEIKVCLYPHQSSRHAPSPHALKPQTGSFKSQAASWISCSSPTARLRRRADTENELEKELKAFVLAHRAADAVIHPLQCPLVWAKESNAFDCVRAFLSSPVSMLTIRPCVVTVGGVRLRVWGGFVQRSVLREGYPGGECLRGMSWVGC